MVILHPCFCFFMKALWFLTTFQTTSVDIYSTLARVSQKEEGDEDRPPSLYRPIVHLTPPLILRKQSNLVIICGSLTVHFPDVVWDRPDPIPAILLQQGGTY